VSPATIIIVAAKRGMRRPPARARANDANACVKGSTFCVRSWSSYCAAGVTIESASGTIRNAIGRGPTGSPST
jgi:hypothetical protein